MRVACITGANSGLGYEVAKQLMLSDDTKVVITTRTEDNAKAAVEALKKETGRNNIFAYAPMDQAMPEQVKSFRQWLVSSFTEGIDLLINNAGVAVSKKSEHTCGERAKITTDINYFGLVRISEALLPQLNKDAKIVNLASRSGVQAFEETRGEVRAFFLQKDQSKSALDEMMQDYIDTAEEEGFEGMERKSYHSWPYCFSKLGVLKYTEILAKDPAVISKNILVVSCCPGWTATKLAGLQAPRTVSEGVVTPLMLTSVHLDKYEEYQGKFFEDSKVSDWKVKST